MRLVPDPFHNAFRGAPETNNEGMFAQAGQVFGIGDESATGGDDRIFHVLQLRHDIAFLLTKARFAIRSKNVADAFVGHAFDHFVGIDKGEF